mgnify:FL=1
MGYFELDMTQEEQLASIFKRIDKELSPFATQSVKAVRKNVYTNDDLFRSEFGIDIDKILHGYLI